MKAAVLRDLAQPIEIEDVTIAKPIGREVLVQVKATSLCHSDLHVLDGFVPQPLPLVLGHEVAGVVEQVGPDVRGVKPGDHVIVCLAFHCGRCETCESGHLNRCLPRESGREADEPVRLAAPAGPVTQFANIAGFAEQVLVHDSGVVPIRKDMPFDRACLIGCGVTTGVGAVTRTAKVQPGEIVAVVGCGGVGLSAINGAHIAGAGRIIAVDRVPAKLELAHAFGATDVVDASAGNVVEQVRELTGGRGVDHAIEAIGLKETVESAFAMLAMGGTATIIGMSAMTTKLEIPMITLMHLERKLQGSFMGGVRTKIDIPRYVDLYMDGRLKLDDMVSKRRRLSEINEAIADMREAQIARSVFTFA